MLRLAALGLACSFAFSAPALAVPVSFVLSKKDPSSIDFECTPSPIGDDCGVKDPAFSFKNNAEIIANPGATFDFLRFKANDADSDDSNDDEDSGDSDDDDDRVLSGTFTATIKLFMQAGGSTPITLFSTGEGSYSTEDGAFRTFSLIWAPIANFTADGVGTFSAAFEDIDLSRAVRLSDNDEYDDDDDWEDSWKKSIAVSATITPVPLPAGSWLLLSSIAVLGAARLRRRAKA